MKSILVRFDLDNPEHKQAYELLLNKDKRKFKSNSELVIQAVNSYFNKDDSELEQLIRRCFAELTAGLDVSKVSESANSDGNDIDWDFVGGEKPDLGV